MARTARPFVNSGGDRTAVQGERGLEFGFEQA